MASPPGVTGPVNLGNAGEFTIRQLAELVLTLTGSASRLVAKPLPEDDPRQRRPDLTRAEADLGWRPSTALQDGLMRTIGYFRDLLELSGDELDARPPALRRHKVA